jgi:hypothetical protein
MGGSDAQLSIEESVDGIIKILKSATLEDSGTFKHSSGAKLPW